ncbi:MAG: hypothetical protein MSA56_11260 [Clostridium sp.]|nr:hypothetical protein [Clostridium sp.]
MAKYMQDSTDIQINEVSGTDNINFSFKSGNSLSQEINNINTKIGDLTQLNTTNKSNLVGAINSIVESGSNANGDYIKYSDGTMICTKKVSFVGLQFTIAWGNVYETPPVELGDYAQEFVDIPLMFITAATSSAVAEGVGNTKTSFGKVTFYRPIRTEADYTYTFYLMAIGKWR